MRNKNIGQFFAVALVVLSLSACATSGARKSAIVQDPIEPVNRAVFVFNDFLDKIILEPVAKAYKAVLPTPVRTSVRSFLRNLKSPVILANNLFQGDLPEAGNTTARFLMNTVLGVGGFYDFAATQGLEYRSNDFGKTMASYGTDSGAYIVLPIFGPSTARDALGLVVDSVMDPVRIVSNNTDNDWIYYTRGIVQGIDTRSRLIEGMDDLRRNSLDYYTATKSSYIQNRMKELYGDGKLRSDEKETVPSYDDFE